MENVRSATRRLLAFSATVLLCGAVPDFLLERSNPSRRPTYLADNTSIETLLPARIGAFNLVSRWRTPLEHGVIEEGAIYRDAIGKQMAQIALQLNRSGAHNGLACYLSHGIPLQKQHIEQVRASDSEADFNIAFVSDQSLTGAGQATLLIATTECMPGGCTEAPMKHSYGVSILRSEFDKNDRRFKNQLLVPLSITLQSLEPSGNALDQEHALRQFRELVSSFGLLPLRTAHSSN